MPLFRNILNFWNRKSAAFDIFGFVDLVLIFSEKSEVICPVSETKQGQW